MLPSSRTIHGARELRQHAITSRVGNTAAVVRSMTSRAAARARKVPASSWLIRREYPATSAAKLPPAAARPFVRLVAAPVLPCPRQWCSGRGRGSSSTLPPGRRRAPMGSAGACNLARHPREAERQRLLPFVARLACADTPEIERERASYIEAHTPMFSFEEGLQALEGALAIAVRVTMT
jgi:hypothetical protein